jgi:hypothetical protein
VAGTSVRGQREGARPSLVAEEAIGVVATGVVATGVVETGVVETGVVEIGAVVTGVAAIGVIIIITMMSFSSAASAFRCGGAGAIHMDITAMGTPTITTGTAEATDTEAMDTAEAMDTVTTAMVMVMDTALLVDQGSLSCSAGLLALAIIVAPSMESWGLRREEQFGLTNATT